MASPRLGLLVLAATASAIAAMAALCPATARAQSAAPPVKAAEPAQPVVTPPVVKTNEGVSYPRRALDEGFREPAQVTLTLTIDATGHVSDAVVTEGAGHGFDEASLDAARKLVFDPATKDGKPVPARIRFVYRFTPPPGVLAGRVLTAPGERPVSGALVVVRDAAGHERTTTTAPDGTWRIGDCAPGTYHVTVTAPGMTPHVADIAVQAGEEVSATDRLSAQQPAATAKKGPGAAEEVVEEVEVHGEKPPREVTKRTLEQREIARIPGTNGDALRSLQNLPGVARAPALAGVLIVRGSAPADTQYFVDGTPVPIVYHFGGLSSVVPTEMLDRIDFYPGNFGTQYGRAMGGIVDVGLTDPKSDRLHAMAQADLIDTRALVQGPLFNTGWTFAIAGRRSWFDTWLGPVLSATGAGVSVAPVYYDYQAILQRQLDKHSTLRFAVFGSDDRFDILLKTANSSEPDLAGTIGSHTGFWRAQALYKNKISDSTELRAVAAVGEDYIEFNVGNIFLNLTQWPVTSRIELAEKLDPKVTLNTGIDVYYAPYTVSAQLPPPPTPGQPPSGPFSSRPPVATTANSSLYEPAFYMDLEMTPWEGGRLVPGVRLDYTKDTKSWDLAPRFVFRQDVTREPRTTIKAGAGLFTQPPQPQETNAVFGTPGLTSNRAYHYDVGVERVFTRNIEASLEGFYKQLDHLVEAQLGNTGTGVVYGGETLIRYKPDERFFGWIAYTLSQSLRRTQPGAPLRTFQFDETHILTVLGSYRIGRGWELGMRYRLSSGYMYTPNQYGFYDENVGTYVPLSAYPPNGSRLPLFHSLDIRVDKTWLMKGGVKIGAYLDVLNVYNQANVAGISYDFNYTHSAPASDLPIIPSVGLRIEY
jgi:TonB family protein